MLLKVIDELQQFVFVDVTLISWHQRLITRGDLRIRQQNGITNIFIIRADECAIAQWHEFLVKTFERRRIEFSNCLRDSRCNQAGEKDFHPIARVNFLARRARANFHNPPVTSRKPCPAFLNDPRRNTPSRKPICANTRRLKPFHCEPPRHDILLDAKRGNIKTVDHILGRKRKFHRATDRQMQFVDFAIAFLMLDFPHPLFANDIDFKRIRRRNFFVEKNHAPPTRTFLSPKKSE